jgi:hypothetical protein
MSGYTDLDALKDVDEALGKIDEQSRARVLSWVSAKYLGTPLQQSQGSGAGVVDPEVDQGGGKQQKGKAKPKAAKKAKASYKQLKELNLKPTGKKSAADFVSEKNPSNNLHKCIVALYYFVNEMEVDQVSVDHIYTFYKVMGWPVPADLVNTLQQTGSKGWSDTSTKTDLKITHMGENVVEHELPAPVKG